MPKPPTLSPTQHTAITAALFRREDTSTIAKEHSISERQVRRIAQNLRTYGSVSAPRTKKMGRPNVLTKDIEDDLRDYVGNNPLALLSDMQAHINAKFNVKVSRASLSRRMKELGFTRGVVRRGPGAADPMPQLSQVDYARLVNEEGIAESGNRTKYAWLLDGEPVPRRTEMDGGVGGERTKKRRGMVGSGKGHREKRASTETTALEDHSIQPDLETATNTQSHEDLDVLGNVASLSEYAMPLPLDQQAHRDDADAQHQQQEYFQPLRQHLPPYLPPLERALQGVNPFQPASQMEYPS